MELFVKFQAACLFVAVSVAPAAAVPVQHTFFFDSGSIADLSQTEGPVTVDVTGGVVDAGGTNRNAPFNGADADTIVSQDIVAPTTLGLGIDNTPVGGTFGFGPDASAELDNNGLFDFLRFTFSGVPEVRIVNFVIGSVGDDDNFDFAIDGQDVAVIETFGTDVGNSFASAAATEFDTGSGLDFLIEVPMILEIVNSDDQLDSSGQVIEFYGNASDDDFRVGAITIEYEVDSVVPLPAPAFLLLAGLGLLALHGRRANA